MREDWVELELGDVCDFIGGGTPSKREASYWGGKIPWASIKDIKGDELHETLDFITEDGLNNSASNLASVGDIILATRINPGKPIFSNIVTAINQDLKVVKPRIEIDRKFLFYGFKTLEKKVVEISSGTTVLGINLNNLKSMNFSFCSLSEQRAIVAKIETLFSDLDKGIADLKTAQAQLKVYRQAVLKKAFEGELTKQWRDQQTNLPTAEELLAQIKEERQKHYEHQLDDWRKEVKAWEENGKEGRKPRKPTTLKPELDLSKMVQELNQLPNNWTYINLDYAVYKLGDGLHGTPTYSETGNYYFINGNNLDNGKIKIKFNTKKVDSSEFLKYQKELNQDTVFVSINGTIGNVSFYNNEKVILGKSACYFNLLINFDKEYIRWRIDSLGFRNYAFKNATGSTIKNVSLSAMRNYTFSLCSKREQSQVVREIESRLSVCDKVEQSITESLEKSKALRQSILKKAFEGMLLSETEIAACKAEKDYEPASVLLERIKVEKNKQ